MMPWFSLIFPIGMILLPAGYLLLFRPRLRQQTDPDARAKVTRLQWILWIGTLASVMLVLLAYGWAPQISRHLWMLFFPLWFGCVMPVLMNKYPSLGNVHHDETSTRSASLRSRVAESPVPRWGWAGIWLVWLVALVAIVIRAVTVPSSVQQSPWWIAFCLHLLVNGMVLLITPWAFRQGLQEAEPMDPKGSVELREGYQALRRFRFGGLFVMVFVIMTGASIAMTVQAYQFDSRVLLFIGAIGGPLIGIAGGVFGTIASVRRAKLNDLRIKLTQQQKAPSASR